MDVIETKYLSSMTQDQTGKKGELENEGGSHDVIENKGKQM
jgi:hypothetical protein